MMDNRNTLDDLSADCLPVPVCRFAFDDGEVVVCGTNQRFDDRLRAVGPNVPLADVFERDELNDWAHVRRALRDGEQFAVTISGDCGPAVRYLVDVTSPDESADGYLVFTDVTDVSDGDWGSKSPPEGAPSDETVTAASATEPFEGGIAVDHVASVVSHDLRNPLDVARARLQAARELDEDEHFDHVDRAHERMERIIQDVLTLARGEDVVDPDETVDLGTVAEQAWETVETNGATLTVEDELPTALADSDRVSRLFENLFRNAIEHGSTRQPGSVRVTVGNCDDDAFYVADDGPGIPEDRRQQVLEPGYSSDEHGTGLGLAIVARIADLHGWNVSVSESASGGAQFEIRGVNQQ